MRSCLFLLLCCWPPSPRDPACCSRWTTACATVPGGAVPTALGNVVATLLQALICATGLWLLARHSAGLLHAVRLVGAIYLVLVGARIAHSPGPGEAPVLARPGGRH